MCLEERAGAGVGTGELLHTPVGLESARTEMRAKPFGGSFRKGSTQLSLWFLPIKSACTSLVGCIKEGYPSAK